MQALWLYGADLVRKHYLWILALSAVATVVFAFGIPRLEFRTSLDTIVSSGSQAYKDNVRYEQ